MHRILTLFFLLSFTAPAAAGQRHAESWYQQRWCAAHHGIAEVALADGTRVDCLTATHAIEFDFGRKWAEAVGQSLHYARRTGRRAGIVLILEEPADSRCWLRLESVITGYALPIDLWTFREP